MILDRLLWFILIAKIINIEKRDTYWQSNVFEYIASNIFYGNIFATLIIYYWILLLSGSTRFSDSSECTQKFLQERCNVRNSRHFLREGKILNLIIFCRFREDLKEIATIKLRIIRDYFQMENEIVTFVGVHYRGTDYLRHLSKMYNKEVDVSNIRERFFFGCQYFLTKV